MILPTPSLAALSIALFVSSVASFETGNKREDSQEVDEACAGTIRAFNGALPKECAYKEAIKWGRTKPFADVYHDDVNNLCPKIEGIMRYYPSDCILDLVEKWDKENPPPTEESENGVVSIKYPSGEVRPLVDNIWYEGVECTKISPDSSIPHECLYRRICFGQEPPLMLACGVSDEYLQKMEYDRSEIHSQIQCARKMLCNRDEKPPQQSKEDQEREKAKESFIEKNKPTLDNPKNN